MEEVECAGMLRPPVWPIVSCDCSHVIASGVENDIDWRVGGRPEISGSWVICTHGLNNQWTQRPNNGDLVDGIEYSIFEIKLSQIYQAQSCTVARHETIITIGRQLFVRIRLTPLQNLEPRNQPSPRAPPSQSLAARTEHRTWTTTTLQLTPSTPLIDQKPH